MIIFRYALKSLIHFWKLNLTIILGVALSTAILLGAFIIGDSVSFSLKQITLQRLGNATWVITAGERLFREELAAELASEDAQTTPLLFANGMAVLDGGRARANQLQVWGVTAGFDYFAGTDSLYKLAGNEAVINQQLSDILGVVVGGELLLRVNKLSTFPANTPFVSADESTVSFRVKVKAIATAEETGNFNLQNIQSSPKNIFISIDLLNRQMQLSDKANIVLTDWKGNDRNELLKCLSTNWQLNDINLQVRENEALNYTELVSDRVFIEPSVTKQALSIENSYPVLSYFVNQIQLKNRLTPYSFVAGLSNENSSLVDNGIIITNWLADDLGAELGDSLQLNYFEVGPLRQLVEKTAWFSVAGIVEMLGPYADVNLMPDIPGLSDAGHCSDWETGVPVDLSKIRQKDEDYWNEYKGTPKAFVNLQTAQRLWGNRFGLATAIRVEGLRSADFENQLLKGLVPLDVGFQVKDARSEGLQAAGQGVDFGELFIGLSFFVLFAALLLAYLMFLLYLNFRRAEIGTLHALGFAATKIRRLFFVEALFLVIVGAGLGLPLGLAYNSLILDAINTIWREIVRTTILHIHVTAAAIVQAVAIVSAISLASVWLILRNYANRQIVQVQHVQEQKTKPGKWSLLTGTALVSLSTLLLLIEGIGREINPLIFYISGFGLLPGLILLVNIGFVRFANLGAKGLSYRHFLFLLMMEDRRRNMLVISFLSVGVFLVLSTGMNRKDLTAHAERPSSGTGGFTFFAETSFPVLHDLNSAEGRFEVGVEELQADFVQFQAVPGDDASCLNLNRVSRPRLLGFDPSSLDKRQAFSFTTKTDELDAEHPWLSLNKLLPNGQIPAIADQTVIKWGLGKSVGDTLVYQNEAGEPVVLKLIGGLANSVFQGNILIGDSLFYANFPSVSGSQVFLIQAPELEEEALRSAFRNYGLELTTAKERLLLFYQIENTYLNIFLMLGALGLLIGTIGLGIIIFRSIFEKQSQYALLEAIGFRRNVIRRMVLRGNLFLVVLSLCIGLIPAVLAALPSLLSSLYAGLLYWSLFIFWVVLANAWLWVFIGNRLAMKSNLYEALRNE
ncbi:ABC transporter permease [Gaoshiqia sediminis]|uniref:FtsX-like permease family protein n=1 Tax=Gaoshiqia sediminis TaxID=2986998 RepID=A0AA42C801_9BACT|nr:FtsX-like permease family protein [Gaoshiqia sediminis]MCW0482176.1 FtsX-like permease family protein [Gaoshiqia sediminis]